MTSLNPYYHDGNTMRLYYEYQVIQCLPIIAELKKQDEEDRRKKAEQEKEERLDKMAEKRKKMATRVLVEELVHKRNV